MSEEESRQEVRDQALIEAIGELRGATEALRTLIEKDYPTRRELERRFVEKAAQRNRVGLVILTLLASMLASFFATVSTVSACFLGEDDHPAICGVMPGYAESEERNDELLKQFVELQKRSIKNERRIERLEQAP